MGPTPCGPSAVITVAMTSRKNVKTTTLRPFSTASSTISIRRSSLAEPSTVPGA